jgi:hypothetical protein
MIAEVANALFLTYIATEYIIASQDTASTAKRVLEHSDDPRCLNQRQQHNNRYQRWAIVTGIVVLINVLDEVLGVTMVMAQFVSRETHAIVYALCHTPRIVVAASAYMAALYWDCQRTVQQGKQQRLRFWKDFLPRVVKAFLTVLPLYPLAAIVISFGFLILITIFETLRLPEQWLNWPIYYGTLYGPFSYIYHIVKLSIVKESQLTLPRNSSSYGEDGGYRLGGGRSVSV